MLLLSLFGVVARNCVKSVRSGELRSAALCSSIYGPTCM